MLIRNATLADGRVRDIRVGAGRIETIGQNLSAHDERVRAVDGDLLLPGMIDTHVHFREPGYSHKETWVTGSKSAAAGGVTSIVDQPNTDPPTVTKAAFEEKRALARASYVDFGINGGVTAEWEPEKLLDQPLFALGEVFLADSTGNMGIETDLFADAVRRTTERGVTLTVHAEDATRFDETARDRADADAWSQYRTPEAEAAAVEHACAIANDHETRIHLAHTSTPEGIDRASAAGMTCEVTPHHLFLSRDDLAHLGTFGRMNPPLRSEERRKAVYERVVDGTVEMIATDHAPHTRSEKDASIWDAPSGVPGVETALPLLLEEARRNRLSYEQVRDLTAANPARVFDLPRKGRIEEGRDADLVAFDPTASRTIRGEELHSNCGWTPFEGKQGVFPKWTMVQGKLVYEDRTGDFGDPVGENVRG